MNLNRLKEEQLKLAKKVIIRNEFEDLSLIAGCDQAFVDDKIISAIVVLDIKTLEIVERAYSVMQANFPYIPGFLSYREAPAIIEAFSKLEKKPHILMIDANGILHPRKIGMASHVGVLLDIPTIGIAKNLLLGEVKEDKIYVDDEVRAMKVSTKEQANPLYVSPGHKITLTKSVELVKETLKLPHKLPEPLHKARRYSKILREDLLKQSQPAQNI